MANDVTDMCVYYGHKTLHWVTMTMRLINHKLACKLDEIATTVQNTNQLLENILFAMLHLALHYKRGIGVQQKSY